MVVGANRCEHDGHSSGRDTASHTCGHAATRRSSIQSDLQRYHRSKKGYFYVSQRKIEKSLIKPIKQTQQGIPTTHRSQHVRAIFCDFLLDFFSQETKDQRRGKRRGASKSRLHTHNVTQRCLVEGKGGKLIVLLLIAHRRPAARALLCPKTYCCRLWRPLREEAAKACGVSGTLLLPPGSSGARAFSLCTFGASRSW